MDKKESTYIYKQMKVLYDSQIFDRQNFGGISRCFSELINHFPPALSPKIGLYETNNVYLNNLGYPRKGDYYNNFIKKGEFPTKRRLFDLVNKIKKINYWDTTNQQISIKLIQEGDFDVFHPTYYDDYFLDYLNNKPFVLTIHDMIPEKYPQYFDTKNDFQIKKKKTLAPLASAIIAVSNKTKEDIINILNIAENKIFVIYHATNHAIKPKIIQDKIISYPYILYIGERDIYKNFIPWIKSVKTVLERFNHIKVVCTGKPFNQKEIEYLTQLKIQDKFIHLFAKNDDELFHLYHNAICFVYTSEYEGFGIPILEAYQAHCPVLLNYASCFPEIANEAAIYFNLNQNGDSNFAEVFEKFYLSSTNDKQQLIDKQNKRLEQYSWEKSARDLFNVYQNVIDDYHNTRN